MVIFLVTRIYIAFCIFSLYLYVIQEQPTGWWFLDAINSLHAVYGPQTYPSLAHKPFLYVLYNLYMGLSLTHKFL